MLQLYQLEVCSICLDIIENDERELKCMHKYHNMCIKKWLERSNRCPMCMRDIEEIQGETDESCMKKLMNRCCNRNNVQEINEDERRRTYMNKLCGILGMVFVAVVIIIILQVWYKNL
jgi:hypothetical protein